MQFYPNSPVGGTSRFPQQPAYSPVTEDALCIQIVLESPAGRNRGKVIKAGLHEIVAGWGAPPPSREAVLPLFSGTPAAPVSPLPVLWI